MNFPSDVISKAVAISDQLRQKQLPDVLNKSNASSTINRLSTYRSTLLETSTSEHSHLLRLFYNLYADMVSINRMAIAIEEKQELLTNKMRELAEDLPSHILELARKGNLVDIFKRLPNAWTPPEEVVIEEEEQLPKVTSQSLTLHNATNLSLLSQHSRARRIGLELQDMPIAKTPHLPAKSMIRVGAPVTQQSRVQFLADDVEDVSQQLDDYFTENQFNKGNALSQFNDNDRNFDFMDASIDYVDQELGQYFNNMSPKRKDLNFEDELFTSDFLVPDAIDKNKRLTNTSVDRHRSNQNTSTEAQAPTSSKDYTKTKSTNMNSSQKSSSSSSFSLFRLQLKSPLKVRDNRILKTPPKNARSQNEPLKIFTNRNVKGTTERRSTPRLSFNLFNDTDFSGVEIPTIPTSSNKGSGEFVVAADEISPSEYSSCSQNSSDSPSKSFQLNLTQFCSREPKAEDQFFCSSPYFEPDKTQLFAELSDDILPISPTIQFIGDAHNIDTAKDESFAFSDIYHESTTPATQPKIYQHDSNHGRSTDANALSQSFSQNPKGPAKFKTNQPINQSFIKKITVAPKITRPTALQFIQLTYQNQSDDDSATDDEQIQDRVITSPTRNEEATKTDTISHGHQNKIHQKDATDSATVKEQQKLSTEFLNNSTENIDNVENIILPAPPQFL